MAERRRNVGGAAAWAGLGPEQVREQVTAALAAVDLPVQVARATPVDCPAVSGNASGWPGHHDPALGAALRRTGRALDASLAKSVLALIRDLRARLGMTVLFVAHDLAVARLMGDRIAVMRAGRVVELGPAEQVIGAPREDYTRTLLAAVPEIVEGVMTANRW